MSVVVGLKHNGKVYLASDSQVTRGQSKGTLKNFNNFKIWRVEDVPHCLMAYTGTTREAQFIRAMPPEFSELAMIKDEVNWAYIVREILPQMIGVLTTTKCRKDDDELGINSEYFIAYQDKLFFIGADLAVIEIEDYFAMGSGCAEAMGSLASTEGQSVEKRLIKALQASFKTNNYVDYPIVICDTEKGQFKVIDEVSA